MAVRNGRVGFGGVEGGHPADHVAAIVQRRGKFQSCWRRIVPGLEPAKTALADGRTIFDAGTGAAALGEELGHGVGVGGWLATIVVEGARELEAYEAGLE